MKTYSLILLLWLGSILCGLAQETVLFNFNAIAGQAALDLSGESVGTTSSNSVVLTASANGDEFDHDILDGLIPLSFGIAGNTELSGPIDANLDHTRFNVGEVMSFSFDQEVELKTFSLSFFESADQAFVTVGTDPSTTFSNLIANGSQYTYSFPDGYRLPAGVVVDLGLLSGDGFALDSLVVAIPEPSSFVFLALCAGMQYAFSSRTRARIHGSDEIRGESKAV